MVASRRSFIKQMSVAPIALGAVSSVIPMVSRSAFANVAPTAVIGSITGNDPTEYTSFAKWFGRRQRIALLAFNQASASALSSSISYICQQGAALMAEGAQILWSVPCPGARQLESIVAGNYNSLYTNLFKTILATSPKDSTLIYIRPPWEFNLASQQNAAIDKNGNFNGPLFVKAWQQISTIAKAVSPRVYRMWCPNVTTMAIDPLACYPGDAYVEVISQDFYMQSAYNKAGDFSWFLNEARGLQWGANFAKLHGKRYGLSEWGMDSDIFVGDLKSTASWLSGLGTNLQHHCWWDQSAVIDCRISDGTHPGLAAAYRSEFF